MSGCCGTCVGQRVVDGCHALALPTTCSPRASVELDLRTSRAFATTVFLTQTQYQIYCIVGSKQMSRPGAYQFQFVTRDLQLSFEQYADHSCAQIYSFERYMVPTIISKQTAYAFVGLFVEFFKERPKSILELVLKNDAGVVYKSNQFKEHNITIHWNLDTFVDFAVPSFTETDWFRPYSYVRAHTSATLTIREALSEISVAQVKIEFKSNEFGDYRAVGLQGCSLCFRVKCPSR